MTLFVLRKALTVEEREAVRVSLHCGGYYRFGTEKRFIDVDFFPDGVSDIVSIRRSDGAEAEVTIKHGDEAEVVSILEQIKAQALAWAEGAN